MLTVWCYTVNQSLSSGMEVSWQLNRGMGELDKPLNLQGQRKIKASNQSVHNRFLIKAP